MRFAIADIETTGSHASACSIIEIGICVVEDGKVVKEFQSLIQPHQYLPHFITALTGITDQMLEGMPTFEDLASELLEIFNDSIFVAHNVNFDYSFFKAEFESLGFAFNPPRLCTVKLARKAFPGYKSYGLGNITKTLGIINEAPHRALGDARATAVLFGLAMAQLEESDWRKMLARNTAENFLPTHISREEYDKLPERTGVYYFLNEQGKPIYIGKAKNIKKRVRSHFAGPLESEKTQGFIREIHRIDFKETAQELIALLWEDAEIRKHWPRYNRAQKSRVKRYNIFQYEDQKGYVRLASREGGAAVDAIVSFTSSYQCRSWLIEFAERFQIDLRLLNIDTGFHENEIPSKDEHNHSILEAIENVIQERKNYILINYAVASYERSFILIEKGVFRGFGIIPYDASFNSIEDFEPYLERLPITEVNQSIALSLLENSRGWKVIEMPSHSESALTFSQF